MENINDDIILPEAGVETHDDPKPTDPKKKKYILFGIVALAFIALAGSLIYIIVSNNSKPIISDPVSNEPFGYNKDEFNDAMDEVELYISKGDYLSAKDILNNNSLTERMTAAQKYRYYMLLVNLYDESALDDATLREEYEAFATKSLEEIRKGDRS